MKSVIEETPRLTFVDAERHISLAHETNDQQTRLRAINQALDTLRPFRDFGLYALPPYSSILHELYLYYVESQAFNVALSLFLFIHLSCHVYSYPQPYHPSNVERLYTMAKLCGILIPSATGEHLKLVGKVSCDEPADE